MKRSLKVLITALFLSLFLLQVAARSLAAKPQTQTAAAEAAAAIQAIRQQYVAINKNTRRYKKIKRELSGFSLEGGEMVAYFDGRVTVKIVANHYGEGGKALEEYYYSNGKLIFVYRKDSTYNRPLSGRVVKTTESRFYFQNDRLLRWVNEEGKQVAPATDEFKQRQDEYLESSSKFLNGARSKSSTIEAEGRM